MSIWDNANMDLFKGNINCGNNNPAKIYFQTCNQLSTFYTQVPGMQIMAVNASFIISSEKNKHKTILIYFHVCK